ncbi:MAG: nuclear transport factor 2 family protein [Acidobacteria bacterium]|nr:nuclear transport factor 2 family protein [Acidobacteriota bacterium]
MKHGWRTTILLSLSVTLGLTAAAPAFAGTAPPAAQKSQKKDRSREQKKSGDSADRPIRLPDDQAIDLAISEMLAAWQIGNTEMLHKYYADDVMVVSGAWEPPLIGWANFLQAYQRQRERMHSGRMDRTNTYIKVNGNAAWAVYQWDFAAIVDGKPTGARGHTTLILERRADRWLIVSNHTSIVAESQVPQQAPPAGTPKPAAPAGPGA